MFSTCFEVFFPVRKFAQCTLEGRNMEKRQKNGKISIFFPNAQKRSPKSSNTFWTCFEVVFSVKKIWLVHPRGSKLRKIRKKYRHIFGQFWKFRSFCFLKVFSKLRPSKVHWRLFFETKLPQNRFKTCLDNFRDSFGHFRNIEFFHFFQSFPYSTLQCALCKIFTEKITSKHVQNMFDCFWERFLGILKNWRFFQFFGVFPSFDSPGCTGQFFPKKSPQNKFKTCLDTFGKVFGHFRIFKFFSIFFSNFSKFRPSRVHLSICFYQKNYLKACSKRFWTFWGTFLGILEQNESFSIFLTFFHVSTLQGAQGNIFLQKNTSK